MLQDKMNGVIREVNETLAEREELVHTIALALLTRKNLFVLGEPGQAKSQAIDLFRSHIEGARQFEILMSKGIDEEQLFGRLDLASILPGHVSCSVLEKDPEYCKMREDLADLMQTAATGEDFKKVNDLRERMEVYEKALERTRGNKPEILTAGKIPDSHIVFCDEIFKANDGVLNSLLKALNERVYTNEGVTAIIPVVSFFSASNEIPNFNSPEEKCLQALYDRFDFKVCTRYVENKANRMKVLKQKQKGVSSVPIVIFTLAELEQMQDEVKKVTVPDSIFEIADNILCELRGKEFAVSDRTYFGFAPVVQAEAWLSGRTEVIPADLSALVNVLWKKPEEIAVVRDVIEKLIANPLGDKIDEWLARAAELRQAFETKTDPNKALLTLREGLIAIFEEAETVKNGLSENDPARTAVDGAMETVEAVSREAHGKTRFTYLPLSELKALKNYS
ncbi:MAG: AAA family ATPase [Clostridia bacterium]|nr:AAA family ATPase [Clostridia bacterium]